jgi:hypothetical protein
MDITAQFTMDLFIQKLLTGLYEDASKVKISHKREGDVPLSTPRKAKIKYLMQPISTRTGSS